MYIHHIISHQMSGEKHANKKEIDLPSKGEDTIRQDKCLK